MNKNKLIIGIVCVLVVFVGYKYFEAPVGADTQKFLGGAVYSVSGSGVSSSATSITLNSLTLPQNDYPIQDSDLSDTFYMTLEPGNTSRQEFISCTTVGANTGSNVTLSGCTRGLSPISPYTASTSLQFSHSGSSKLIFSNSPNLYDQAAFKGNDETITGTWLVPAPTVDLQIATKKYADDLAIAGAPDASITAKGIFEVGTQIEMASTTAIGGGDTTAPLALTTAYSTSTPDGTSQSGLFVPISENDGFLSKLWTRLTDTYAWTALHSFAGGLTSTATTTLDGSNVLSNAIIINTQAYSFPSSDGTASSTALTTDGSGNLTWNEFTYKQFASTTDLVVGSDSSENTIFTTSIPANLLATDNVLHGVVHIFLPQTTINTTFRVKYGGTTMTTQLVDNNNAATYTGKLEFTLIANSANTQKIATTLSGSASALQPATAISEFYDMATSTASEDSTGALNLVVTAQNSGTGSGGWSYFNPFVEIIR